MAKIGGPQDPENQRMADEVRKRVVDDITNDRTTIREMCEFSKMQDSNKEALYVSRLRLFLLLRAKGWAADEAEDALIRNGFQGSDTIRTIRSRKVRFETFYQIWESPPESVRADKGRQVIENAEWPWRGKLSALADALNVSPAALLGVTEATPAIEASSAPVAASTSRRAAREAAESTGEVDSLLDDLLGDDE